MSKSIDIGGRGRKKLPEVTDEEAEQIREQVEKFGVKQATKSGGKKKLHPIVRGDTLCKIEMGRVDKKDVGVFPPGFFPICKRCAYHWRES